MYLSATRTVLKKTTEWDSPTLSITKFFSTTRIRWHQSYIPLLNSHRKPPAPSPSPPRVNILPSPTHKPPSTPCKISILKTPRTTASTPSLLHPYLTITKTIFCRVPSHCAISGNEAFDQAVKTAATFHKIYPDAFHPPSI